MSRIIACSARRTRRPSFLCSILILAKSCGVYRARLTATTWAYDPVRKRIYITGDGEASVFEQRDADHYVHIAEVPTGYRARNVHFCAGTESALPRRGQQRQA